MNPDFTIEDVIARIGEEGAFRFFVYTTEEFPLDARGWDGMAHLAHFCGDLDRATAYLEHSQFLATGVPHTTATAPESAYFHLGNTAAAPSTAAGTANNSGCALIAKVAFWLGACCCIGQFLCNHPTNISTVTSEPTSPSVSESKPVVPSNQNQTPSSPPRPVEVPSAMSDIDLQKMTMFDLDCIRNEPFARHGYRFKRSDLRGYFERKPWYKATTDDQDRIWRELTGSERATIAAVKTEQSRRKQR